MVLVYVLWGVALLSMLAVSVLSGGNASYHVSHNALETAQTDAAAEAALARAVLALLDPRPERRWRVDGTAHDFTFASARMRIALQDELGRIDLNHADQSLLVRLYQSAGLDFSVASALVDKILDWRDPSPARRLNGAKDEEYRAAGFAYRPRNGAFQSVGELELVMGMTAELYKRVEPALTVYSGRQFFDPQFAPREALLALPGMGPNAVDSLVAARAAQAPRAVVIDPARSLQGRAFSIRVEIARGERVLMREFVVRLTGQPLQPYWVLSWRSR